MNEAHKQALLSFLKSQQLATIATITSTKKSPESALIAFTEDDNLNLYFQTGKHTRKAANLHANPYVSLVIGLRLEDKMTMQYEGVAHLLTDEGDLLLCKQLFVVKKSPTTDEYFNRPMAIFFKVTPTWIGFSDYSKEKPHVVEIKSF